MWIHEEYPIWLAISFVYKGPRDQIGFYTLGISKNRGPIYIEAESANPPESGPKSESYIV